MQDRPPDPAAFVESTISCVPALGPVPFETGRVTLTARKAARRSTPSMGGIPGMSSSRQPASPTPASRQMVKCRSTRCMGEFDAWPYRCAGRAPPETAPHNRSPSSSQHLDGRSNQHAAAGFQPLKSVHVYWRGWHDILQQVAETSAIGLTKSRGRDASFEVRALAPPAIRGVLRLSLGC